MNHVHTTSCKFLLTVVGFLSHSDYKDGKNDRELRGMLVYFGIARAAVAHPD